MKYKCDICGKEYDQHDMIMCSPSPARPKWLCWECHKQAQREVFASDQVRRKRLIRMHEK